MDLETIRQAVIDGDVNNARLLAEELVNNKEDLIVAIQQGFLPAIQRVGELWSQGEYFLPELVQSAEAMKTAMEILSPALGSNRAAIGAKGRVVIGTVEGDLHDIGKSLVGTLLTANGFDVYDLGSDVPIDKFVAKAAEVGADIIGASALLTTTMQAQANLVAAVAGSDIPKKPTVLVGGAPTSAMWADKIGACYAENALDAVRVAKNLV